MNRSTVQVTPRRSGIVVFKDRNEANEYATSTLRDTGSVNRDDVFNALAFRPFAGIKLSGGQQTHLLTVIVKLEFLKNAKTVWTIYDPLPFSRGIISYPKFALNPRSHPEIGGKWQLKTGINFALRENIPARNRDAFFHNRLYAPVTLFAFEIKNFILRVSPTGERLGNVDYAQDVVVRMDDI